MTYQFAHDEEAKRRKAPVFDSEDDETFSHGQHMIAGAMAGITEHICMFPVDTIKTRMQAYVGARDLAVARGSAFRAARQIVHTEGAKALWRGVGAVALSAGPAHALYFAVYEMMKDRLGGNRAGHQPAAVAASGALATVASETVMTPMDVIKQRMQLLGRSENLSTVIRRVYNDQGLSAFFKSYKTTLVMNVPYTAIQFSIYESMKTSILEWRGIDENLFSPSNHIVAGGIAGAAASGLTNPLDVVKTRLQTQGEIGARRYMGMTHALRVIYAEEGLAGFMRGVRPRMLFHTPAVAICWTTYEFSKRLIFDRLNGTSVEAGVD